jgi:hypothetical protein
MPRPAVVGVVASVSGTTLTVSEKHWKLTGKAGDATNAAPVATSYTVDASNATVTKNGAASTVSAIAVGDTVMVSGTVNGTQVTATTIRDGVVNRPGLGQPLEPGMEIASHTPAIAGNGQPVIGGNVTAVSGNTLTVTNASNVTYTVDATSAKIVKAGVTGATLSSIAVGDSVVVQGTVNGTSVVAASVIDQAKPSISNPEAGEHRGFMGAIGGFFAHLFGF